MKRGNGHIMGKWIAAALKPIQYCIILRLLFPRPFHGSYSKALTLLWEEEKRNYRPIHIVPKALITLRRVPSAILPLLNSRTKGAIPFPSHIWFWWISLSLLRAMTASPPSKTTKVTNTFKNFWTPVWVCACDCRTTVTYQHTAFYQMVIEACL